MMEMALDQLNGVKNVSDDFLYQRKVMDGDVDI